MKRTKIKYSKDFNSDFEDYLGLGSIPHHLSSEWSDIIPSKNTKQEWNRFFEKETEAIIYETITQFWWYLKEDDLKTVSLPDEYTDNFINNFGSIAEIINSYLIYDELPPPYFKYLDFVHGEQSYLDVIMKNNISSTDVCITFNSLERIVINIDDDYDQLFIPKKTLPKFKEDLSKLIRLIVGK
jgi:hypothetical protein